MTYHTPTYLPDLISSHRYLSIFLTPCAPAMLASSWTLEHSYCPCTSGVGSCYTWNALSSDFIVALLSTLSLSLWVFLKSHFHDGSSLSIDIRSVNTPYASLFFISLFSSFRPSYCSQISNITYISSIYLAILSY